MTEKQVNKMLANPFYCLEKVDPIFTEKHEPLVSEQEWISAGATLIKENGAEKFLKDLLDNLKGNYVR